MDNASYHSRQTRTIPNRRTKKSNILEFIKEKNLAVPQKNPTIKVLLEIIEKQNFEKEYYIDELCKTHDHTLLRLPPYYCIFNPIELIWAYITQ